MAEELEAAEERGPETVGEPVADEGDPGGVGRPVAVEGGVERDPGAAEVELHPGVPGPEAAGVREAGDEAGGDAASPGEGGEEDRVADAGAAAVADDLGGGREDDPRIEGERAVDPAGERTGTLPGVGLGARDLAGEADDLRVPGFDERPRREERPELGGDRARGGERSGGRRGPPRRSS